MPRGFTPRGKEIFYKLYKKPNRALHEFRGGRGNGIDRANLLLLRYFKSKGLVRMTELSSGNIYNLTDEGQKVAKKIVKEIDDLKKWIDSLQ